MIIPSIDLVDGRAVQLRQGREHVLTSDRDPVDLAREYNRYGPVAAIDLDAALGTGDNLELIGRICRVAEARVGGGIRDAERGRRLLRAGARQLIFGTAATPELLGTFDPDKVTVALDHRGGVVVDKGWTRSTGESVADRARRLAPYCSGFLCTFVEREGCLQGIPLDEVETLKRDVPRPITVAGGVASTDEAVALSRLGVDVQVGMALYTGKLDLAEATVGSLDFEKMSLLPTIVQDRSGQVLMLAYSSRASLLRALRQGTGTYYSRSRQEIWQKGATSGNRQQLLSVRADCDRDALLFTVQQTGVACHEGRYSCFGQRAFSAARLFDILKQRIAGRPEGSYTVELLENRELLRGKILEEAHELTRAPDRDNLQWEAADLLYHMGVLLAQEGLTWQDVLSELSARHRG